LLSTIDAQKATTTLRRRIGAQRLLNPISLLSRLFVFELHNKKVLDQSSDGREIFILIYKLFEQKHGYSLHKQSFKKTVILTFEESATSFEISIQARDLKRPCFDHYWYDSWPKEYDLMDIIKVDLRQELMLILCLTKASHSKEQKLCCALCNKTIFSLNNIMIDQDITILPCDHILHKNCLYTLSAGQCCPFCKEESFFSRFKAIYATRPFNNLTAEFFT
jgi:hypothetical protein